MTSERRLIEDVLPLREISAEAAREKSIRHGHISTLHIWWARRPLVACRAAVLGAILRVPTQSATKTDYLDFLQKFSVWESSNDEAMIRKARGLVREDNDGVVPKVLDCFAGGGAIPLESLRVGCDAYALELNPVAVLIELCTLVYPLKYGHPFEVTIERGTRRDGKRSKATSKEVVQNKLLFDVRRWGSRVLEEARKEVGRFYPPDPDGSVPVAFLWARTLPCPNPRCRAEVPLVRQLWLAKKAKKRVALRMYPSDAKKTVSFEVVEGEGIDFDPLKGTMKLGSMKCPVCSEGSYTKTTLKEAAREVGFGLQPLAVVLSSGEGGKRYRTFGDKDRGIFEAAKNVLNKFALQNVMGLSVLPEEPISRDYDWVLSPPLFGLTKFADLFNPRQLLTLTVFARKVAETYGLIREESGDDEYAKAVTTYLAIALDRLADRCSSLCRWDNPWEKIANTFSRQALQMVWDYCEGNPFGGSSGDWEGAVDWVARVIEHCSIATMGGKSDVRQGTATALPYADAFFDAVITDPPYYDSVPYADLSDFFYVWLKRTIGQLYPDLFATPLTPKAEEIVEQSDRVTSAVHRRKDKAFFETKMAESFREMHRVLKPDGICVVVFAHKTTSAWETLLAALLIAGFTVEASWPLHTEMSTRLRARESAALASSVWLVCRKRDPLAPVGTWKQVQSQLEERVNERMAFFFSQGIKGADALLSAIGPATEVFGRYSTVEKVTGESVSVGEFLDKVREVVSRDALASVLKGQEMGAVDPVTAFYVLWKWSYEGREMLSTLQFKEDANEKDDVLEETQALGRAKLGGTALRIDADDALKLARSVGAEFEEITGPGGILVKDREYVRLLMPDERRDVRGLGEPHGDGRPTPIIDVLHRAMSFWASGERAKLEEYLDATTMRANEVLWKLAYALSGILPLDSPEKRVIDGLWGRYGGGLAGTDSEARDRAQTTLARFDGES